MITEKESEKNLENCVMFESHMCAVVYAMNHREVCVCSVEGFGCYFHIWHPRTDVFVVSNRLNTHDDEMTDDDFAICHGVKELATFMYESCAWPASEQAWEKDYDYLCEKEK